MDSDWDLIMDEWRLKYRCSKCAQKLVDPACAEVVANKEREFFLQQWNTVSVGGHLATSGGSSPKDISHARQMCGIKGQ